MVLRRPMPAFVLCLIASIAPIHGRQAETSYELARVQVSGAKRYTPEDVTRVSGLQIGKPITIDVLSKAADRMSATELFRSVGYKYVTTGRQMSVTFEIEEPEWTIPVVLDNFVSFTDEQIAAAVRQDVPSFDGTSPMSAGVPELIRASLEKFLKSRKVDGRVEFLSQTVLKTNSQTYVFSVRDPSPKLCALRVSGASGVPERDLTGALGSVIGNDYSRFYLMNASNGTLLKMYHERGYWRAAFGAPAATTDAAAGCSGVTVTLQVIEGSPYSWERAEWSGNTVVGEKELDRLLGMKQGAIASITKIDDGLRIVDKAYGRIGHVMQTATYAPRLDDSTRKAVFAITIDEGPQFRMGTVSFAGVPDAVAAGLTKKWRLQAGAVYDDSYPDRFHDDEIRPLEKQFPQRVTTERRADVEKRIVNVRFAFGER
jgi:outer membrane protein assembly factor BamA